MLDPYHTTTSLSVDQIVQFASAVGLEVTLAFYGLLEDLLFLARGAGTLGGRGETGRSRFPSLIGSAKADSVESQAKFSLPFVSGSMATAASVDIFGWVDMRSQ